VVNPNNPDGRISSRASLIEAAACLKPRNGWLIVDEAFADVEPDLTISDLCGDLPIIVLRSFGKFYGLPGLRLGFAIAPEPIASAIEKALGPWPVSGPALAIGTAALADTHWADETRRSLDLQAKKLDRILEKAGLALVGGTPLYRLVRYAHTQMLHENLAKQHIWTRRFDWAGDLLRFGLPPDEIALNHLAAALVRNSISQQV
jgi:cobalamin biosynthetic protein CobC